MKITDSDYQTLKGFIDRAIEANPTRTEAAYQEADLNPTRMRWDLLYLSGVKIGDGVGTSGDVNLYAYLDDDHIDTALRAICKEAGLEWAAQPKPAQRAGMRA